MAKIYFRTKSHSKFEGYIIEPTENLQKYFQKKLNPITTSVCASRLLDMDYSTFIRELDSFANFITAEDFGSYPIFLDKKIVRRLTRTLNHLMRYIELEKIRLKRIKNLKEAIQN